MASKRERIKELMRKAMADSALSEEEQERVDEIHRSAICTAQEIAGHYDRWSHAYEAALYKELKKRQGEIQRLRQSASARALNPIRL